MPIKVKPIYADRVRELFDYRDGKLYWRETRNAKALKGTVAGWVATNGYHYACVDYSCYKLSRLVFCWHHGDLLGSLIDHIDGDPTNNRIENLRLVTNAENGRNAKKSSRNKSGVTGVYWYKASRKWHSQIRVDNKQIHLGYFDDFDEAVAARKAADIKYNFHKNHGREG